MTQVRKIQSTAPKIPELVMWALIEAIEDDRIHVGSELPSERDLAEQLGVGRGSLRECLAILEFLGAIEINGNRKKVARNADYIRRAISFVRVSNQWDSQEDFNEFRRVNEVAIAGLAASRATEQDLEQVLHAVERLEQNPKDAMADVAFHDALAVASHNMMLAATIHLVNSMIANVRNRFYDRPDYIRSSQESHRAIFEAVQAGDRERARQEMNRHLDIVDEFSKRYPADSKKT